MKFRGVFLSNFYPASIEDNNGKRWPTVEHAFQAMKTLDGGQREMVRAASTPVLAKRLGRTVTLRADWNTIRLAVMEKLVRAKFAQHQDLAAALLATGDLELVEDNDWGDTFWGRCRGAGQNNLGKILMKIRSELK